MEKRTFEAFCPFTKDRCRNDCAIYSGDEKSPCALRLSDAGEMVVMQAHIREIREAVADISCQLKKLNRH